MGRKSPLAAIGAVLFVMSASWSTGRAQSESPATDSDDAAPRQERLDERVRLWAQAQESSAAGDFAAALVAAERAVAIEIELVGEVHLAVASSYGFIGDLQWAAGDYDRAATAYDKRTKTLAALPDTKPWELVDARQAAADARLRSQLDAAARRKLAKVDSLYQQTIAKYQTGDYRAAIDLAERALLLLADVYGAEHPDAAAWLNNLAGLYQSTAEYARALTLYEQALAIRKRTLGEDHPSTAVTLNDLANLHKSTGEYARARSLFEQALAVNRIALGNDHVATAATLHDLAGLHMLMGEHARALPLYKQALAIRQRELGGEHPSTASALNDLAGLYLLMGQHAQALPLYKRALAIRQQVLGNEHPSTAISLNDLAQLYRSMGEYALALPLFEQAVAIRKEALGEGHPDTATTLHNLAGLYNAMGEYDRAVSLYEQALAIYKQTLGDKHPHTATSLNNLAGIYIKLGEYARALPLCEQALAIYQETLGNDHPSTATGLHTLAGLYHAMGEYDRALTLYEQSLAIRKKVLGEDHPETAISLNNIAHAYHRMGEYALALPRYEQVLAARKRSLGIEHPDTAASLDNLGATHAALDDLPRAAALLLAGASAQRESLQRQLFSFGDARIHSLLGASIPSIDVLASLPLADLGLEEPALEVLVSRKATAFEVLNLRRAAARLAAADDEVAALQQDLVSAQQRLETLALRPPQDAASDRLAAQRRTLRDAIEQLDEQLSRRLTAFLGTDVSLGVSLDQLRGAMAPGSAHVEYFRYHPFDFKSTGDQPQWLPARYAAFVFAAEATGAVSYVDLGAAAEIDALIDRLAAQIEDVKRIGAFGDEGELETQYREVAGALAARIVDPLRTALGDARQVTLGPDGRLHEIAFEALVDDSGQYLVEAGYQFAYVNSGRDLLRKRGEVGTGVAVVAGPDYAAGYLQRLASVEQALGGANALRAETTPVAAADDLRGDGASRGADTRRGWRDLGAAALAEGQEAAAAFVNAGYGPVATYARGDALEDVVKRLVSPRVLVLITHGDFLPNEPAAAPPGIGETRSLFKSVTDRGGAGFARAGLRAIEDPLLRSYLVLAGANEIDEEIPDSVHVENGWLTAREIAELDLRGTDLVVLSACSTNRGDAENGRAVMGMRSAFLFAGARTVVGSLFEVPNAETRQLLKPFYERVAAGDGKLAALNAAKLAFIKERRERGGAAHPFYWASFILVGEP